MAESLWGIDRIDQRILSALQADARISNLKLAEAVALSPTAVLARVQRLTRDGYILGYEARLNPLKLGRGMMVFVEVLLDRTTPNVFEQFKAAVQAQEAILECHMVAGGFDYLLKLRCADMNAYREFAGTVLWQLPGVRETRTYAVMEEVKNSTQLKLQPGRLRRTMAIFQEDSAMRLRLILAVAPLLVTVHSASAQNMKPGLWEHSFTMKSQSGKMEQGMAELQKQIAAMPPEKRKQMEQMMAQSGVAMGSKVNVVKVCVTPEDAARMDMPKFNDQCKQEVIKRSAAPASPPPAAKTR